MKKSLVTQKPHSKVSPLKTLRGEAKLIMVSFMIETYHLRASSEKPWPLELCSYCIVPEAPSSDHFLAHSLVEPDQGLFHIHPSQYPALFHRVLVTVVLATPLSAESQPLPPAYPLESW